MTEIWALAALWLGLALFATLLSIKLRIAAALSEIVVGTIAQLVMNEFGAPWIRASVTKLGALKGVKRLGVTIERGSRV